MLLLFLHYNIVYNFKEHGFFFFSFMESWTVDRSHPIIETLDF